MLFLGAINHFRVGAQYARWLMAQGLSEREIDACWSWVARMRLLEKPYIEIVHWDEQRLSRHGRRRLAELQVQTGETIEIDDADWPCEKASPSRNLAFSLGRKPKR